MIRELFEKFSGVFRKKCLCPTECDCENPPPDDWDERDKSEGVYHISNFCPVHNDFPWPHDECPIHGGMRPHKFATAR